MATTHKMVYAVSATPKVTVDAVAGASMETNSIHEDIRRTLGGSGEVTNDGAIDFGGVSDGSVNYLQATSGGVNIGDGDTRFIWVKHTGYLWSSSSALGSATTDKLNINIDSEHIATLAAGESWIIPLPDTSSTATNFKALRGGSSDIAIEAIGLD
jgi:hypothetical protein|tara:strand:+ start:401 stop:868 length:468 start_codon:yes stop_codon:yes gene_type:complete